MKKKWLPLAMLLGVSVAYADPALTIYNQNFAVVRDTVPLDLKSGVNDVRFANATAHLEPDSVILRDPAGKADFQILEQSYRNDPVSQEMLLSLFEGKTIDFLVKEQNKPDHTMQGKVVRSGYVPRSDDAVQRYGNDYAPQANPQPVIEVDGKLVFELPGLPVFPSLGDDTILKPTLGWKIKTADPVKVDAELAYVTGGMSWKADYNLSSPETGDTADIVGWITMDNHAGRTFDNAKIKLIAGDVNKVQPPRAMMFAASRMVEKDLDAPEAPAVTEKAFDEYHMYTVANPVTLRDQETKQVEFVHASGVKAERVYKYDGSRINGWVPSQPMLNPEFGENNEASKKVAVYREIKNSKDNGLGIPLPKGRIRFYREGDDKQLEFTGENDIDHTPKDETLKIYTGDAFDLTGERKRTNFHVDSANRNADESFEIKLRNHKTTPVQIQDIEHLYRWTNWNILKKSQDFKKENAQEIIFATDLKPDEEKTITYTVHYSW